MTKVKNAQDFGAEVAIISDFPNEAVAEKALDDFDNKNDGVLSSHIPAFEISYADAKNMVNVIQEGEEIVYMLANFDVTKADNTVEVDLWYSTSLDLGTYLASELAAMSISFTVDHSEKPLFTPRIASFDCLTCSEEFK